MSWRDDEHNLASWGGLAENVAESVTKGCRVIEQIGANLDDLEDEINLLAETAELEELARVTAEVTVVARLLSAQARHAQETLAQAMPEAQMQLAGMIWERKRKTDRRAWDWEKLLPTLTRLHVDPEGTGELPDPATVVEAMTKLIVDVVGVTPSKAPKVGGLRAVGLDPDEWCEATPGGLTVKMTGLPTEGSDR